MSNMSKKVLALAMAAALLLSACNSNSNEKPAEQTPATPAENQPATPAQPSDPAPANPVSVEPKYEIKDLVLSQTTANEMTNFNILHSQSQSDSDVLANLVDGLLEVDPDGKLLPCLAEEWGTEDGGLTWTFHIRQGVKWVDMNGNEMADTTAWDFATGLEWVLNYWKNESANTSMAIEMIKGASEYYEMTKAMDEAEAEALNALEGSKFLEMVGIAIPDDYTVVYSCVSEKPYFDSLGTYSTLYPLSQQLVDKLGVDGIVAMNNTDMWYNGGYLMDEYIQGNTKHMVQNPTYWDTEAKRFDSVTVRIIESIDVGFQLFQNGEIDYINLNESNLNTIANDPNHPFYNNLVENKPTKYSWQLYWNYNKMDENGNPDVNFNTAVANKAFRKSVFYGWDITEYLKRQNSINPIKCENNAYTMKGLCYTSDGTDYTDLVRKELGLPDPNGETLVQYNKEKGEQYKAQAIEELTALGVTFPVQIDYYISSSNQTALDTANVIKNTMEGCLGKDYVQLNIKTYVSSFTKEVRNAKLHGMYISGWGADYGDPINYMSQEVIDYDNAFYSALTRNVNDLEETPATEELLKDLHTFTDMVWEADKITDLDARYAAFAKAEAFLIENAMDQPLYYDIRWTLTKINPYSKPNAMYGVCNNKYKNWETSAEPYTTAEIAAIEAARG